MDALKDLIADLVEKIKKLTEAILSRFKPVSDEVATTVSTEGQKPAVGPVVKPETRNPMDPRSVLGIPMNGPDGSANPTELFRGDPAHPKYRPGDGRKIIMVRDALLDGKPWDYYIVQAGEVWDLEVTPDHPSIGFKIPK